MNSKNPALFYFLFILLVGVIMAISFNASANVSSRVAPDFTLKSLDGNNVRLQEQLGNVVVINFWASWCGPCRQELPHFEKFQQDYEDLGFTVLAVNVDENPSKATSLLEDIAVSFPVLFDQQDKVSKLYDVKAMPTTVIVDRSGVQRLTHYGYKSGDEYKYKAVIKALLRE